MCPKPTESTSWEHIDTESVPPVGATNPLHSIIIDGKTLQASAVVHQILDATVSCPTLALVTVLVYPKPRPYPGGFGWDKHDLLSAFYALAAETKYRCFAIVYPPPSLEKNRKTGSFELYLPDDAPCNFERVDSGAHAPSMASTSLLDCEYGQVEADKWGGEKEFARRTRGPRAGGEYIKITVKDATASSFDGIIKSAAREPIPSWWWTPERGCEIPDVDLMEEVEFWKRVAKLAADKGGQPENNEGDICDILSKEVRQQYIG
ncbi:hypothetical protein LTS18_005633 [Coniosporium uncinatum]|uniref:Uncharacterized protein n=1 Tax=Coniosporium uncinatum TaxID=93489 RepID=A0ACC3DCS2_9PEZI|nr:hypothetical protein LTS18_005633 [Coniosporium uncinatum]